METEITNSCSDKIYHIENGEVLEQDCSRFDMIGPNQMIKRCRAF